jgi:hypothetical protein
MARAIGILDLAPGVEVQHPGSILLYTTYSFGHDGDTFSAKTTTTLQAYGIVHFTLQPSSLLPATHNTRTPLIQPVAYYR